MKLYFKTILCLMLLTSVRAWAAGEQPSPEHTFTSTEGKSFTGRLVKFDPIDNIAVFDSKKRIPLSLFCEADQEYIRRWSMTQGFISTFTFKIEVSEMLWGRRRWKRRNIPYWMESLKLENKKTPHHVETTIKGFEENVTVEYLAKGYNIRIRNGNSFPLENIVVHHKVFYEQEEFLTSEDIMLSGHEDYAEIEIKQKVKGNTETVELLEPYKDRILESECALMVQYSMDRYSNDESEDGIENKYEGDPNYERIPGFDEWDEGSERSRGGKIVGLWVKMGMEDQEGQMVYRDFTLPTDLPTIRTWDLEAELAGETAESPGTYSATNKVPATAENN